MTLSAAEKLKQERFAQTYARSQCPVMLEVERRTCGCDYGGWSLTTEAQARWMAELLALGPEKRLLDLGSGAGWPGLYFAKETGCETVLVDLPLSGLRVARDRAAKERMDQRCRVALADGAELPFGAGTFDRISHSDVLCCLMDKRGVLEACRRVIHDDGRMVFTVIWPTPGLAPADHERALAGAPEFGEPECDYPTLLGQCGWRLADSWEVSAAYGDTVRRLIAADRELKDDLEALIGAADYAERQANWQAELSATEAGLVRRDLYVAVPAGSG